jgi:TATA-box binding protein (TBP) (component of TFIID and TFIIIB)
MSICDEDINDIKDIEAIEIDNMITINQQLYNLYPDLLANKDKLEQLKIEIKNSLELNNIDIPKEIKISTMTLEAKFKTRFFPLNIYRYIKKSDQGIVSVIKENRNKKEKKNRKKEEMELDLEGNKNMNAEYMKNEKNTRKNSKNKKSKNKQSEIFLNQVTISIRVSNKQEPVSVKIFNSGTVHFTGCVCIDNLLEAAYKLCIECKREIAIIDNNRKIKEIKFVEDPNELCIENLYDYKVDMINCIFRVPFNIDRPVLQSLLKADGYNASYDSNGHAGVKIKYVSTGKKITIFVFESGSIIIILGKQGFSRINEIHGFIYKYLLVNYENIVKDRDIARKIIGQYITKLSDKTFIKLK